MIRLLLLTVLLGLCFYGAQQLWRVLAPRLTGHWHRIGMIGAVLVLLLLALSGKLTWFFAALGTGAAYFARNLPQVLRWLAVAQNLWRQAVAVLRFKNGQRTVETAWLRIQMDPLSGAVQGVVLAGRFAGRPLQALNMDQLLALLAELRSADHASATLLEGYLNRQYGAGWRRGSTQDPPRSKKSATNGKMTREEAYSVLGVSPAAAPQDIIAAHRRLMQKFHPDRGGSDYLAAKINLAKDVLLRK